MSYSVDWVTKIISIPKVDTTLVVSTPNELRSLDITDFWTEIHDIQDDSVAMPFPIIMQNTPPSTLGGITFGRTVQLINGYTVTFEDGSYGVDLINGNSNLKSNTNFNSVSVGSENSAGLIEGTGGATAADIWSDSGVYNKGEKGYNQDHLLTEDNYRLMK